MATVTERLWSKIDVRGPDECWPWTRGKTSAGYGQLRVAGKLLYAHRLVSEDRGGPLPSNVVVRHSCDNPPCCNPKHLLRGTQRDNVMDMFERGRANHTTLRGEKSGTAKLTADQVMAARHAYASGAATFEGLAAEYGVVMAAMWNAVNGMTWSHLPLVKRATKKRGRGLCECGCGARAPIAKMTNTKKGHVRGRPVRFIRGHHARH